MLRAGAIALGLLVATPLARAGDGLDLLGRVCLDTLPTFGDAARRIASLGGVPNAARNPLVEVVEPASASAWTLAGGPGEPEQRFLVETASGSLDGKPAASCGIADRSGFSLGDAKARLSATTSVERPADPMNVATIDLVSRRPDGRLVWIVLRRTPFDRSSGDARRLSMATVVASDSLDTLISEVR